MLLRVLEVNRRRSESSRLRTCLSDEPALEKGRLSFECLHLSDMLDEPEDVQRDLKRVLVTELLARARRVPARQN